MQFSLIEDFSSNRFVRTFPLLLFESLLMETNNKHNCQITYEEWKADNHFFLDNLRDCAQNTYRKKGLFRTTHFKYFSIQKFIHWIDSIQAPQGRSCSFWMEKYLKCVVRNNPFLRYAFREEGVQRFVTNPCKRIEICTILHYEGRGL
jgi:hypothetical protein